MCIHNLKNKPLLNERYLKQWSIVFRSVFKTSIIILSEFYKLHDLKSLVLSLPSNSQFYPSEVFSTQIEGEESRLNQFTKFPRNK